MGIELAANEYGFRALAGLPILILGFYVLKSNPKELSNRVFAGFCLVWTMWIVAVNVVSLSTDRATAHNWNELAAYALVIVTPALLHFVLVFPYRSRLVRRRWLVPALYSAAAAFLLYVIYVPDLFLNAPVYDFAAKVFSPNFRPVLYFIQGATFTIATLFLVLRYTFTDLEVTRKRLFFVLFALATYSIYNAIGDVHINASESFRESFQGLDLDYWRLTLVSDALVILIFFAMLGLLAYRTRSETRRRECYILLGSGAGALVTGYFDDIIRALAPSYPGALWLWRIASVALMFYAILKYQLFDLHVRIRVGVKYGSMTTIFAAVFFTVQELVKDYGPSVVGDGNRAFGYFVGLLAAAALVFLFTPVQHLIERFSARVVPPTSTETYERYRAMEIYRAALEGALADRNVSIDESHALKNLRDKLSISEADHHLLERDIRSTMDKAAV